MILGLTQPITEMSTRITSWGQRRPVRRADNLVTFKCRLSSNLGASTSWKPQGLSQLAMGQLYLYSVLLEGHSAAGRIMSMNNFTDTIGNRTRDLPAFSAVPQPTTLPRAPVDLVKILFLATP
jgi:hypothetical protein